MLTCSFKCEVELLTHVAGRQNNYFNIILNTRDWLVLSRNLSHRGLSRQGEAGNYQEETQVLGLNKMPHSLT